MRKEIKFLKEYEKLCRKHELFICGESCSIVDAKDTDLIESCVWDDFNEHIRNLEPSHNTRQEKNK